VESQRGGGLFNRAVLNSLKTIRAAKSRFHLLTAHSSTQAVLVSQIELCDVLLDEIRTISCSLEKRMKRRSVINRRSMATSRNRSSRYRAVPQRDAPTRSKQRK
jgi:hypothetical protein